MEEKLPEANGGWYLTYIKNDFISFWTVLRYEKGRKNFNIEQELDGILGISDHAYVRYWAELPNIEEIKSE